MRDIYGFLQLVSRLANRPFGHPSQVRTQVLVLQTCVHLRQLASPFGQGLKQSELVECKQRKEQRHSQKYSQRFCISIHTHLSYTDDFSDIFSSDRVCLI